MKFAKVFQQVLSEDHVPEEWIERAIQYKKLKKRINKVVEELESIGVSKNTVQMSYDFEMTQGGVIPKLKMSISPLLKDLILGKLDENGYEYKIERIKMDVVGEDGGSVYTAVNPFDDDENYYEVSISLEEDTKFFQILYEEIEGLKEFKEKEEKQITTKVEVIASDIANVTIPNMKKNDMYVWREIFQKYIEAEVFFSTVESNAGRIDINLSKERYFKFINMINTSGILDKFHKSNSLAAFNEFKKVNFEMLKFSNYENFNNLAVKKILKKFDKQTQLFAKEKFPLVVNQANEKLLNLSVAKDVCYIISSKLLTIIPQIDDYLCPICCAIAFKPIRLECGHLFCIRCLVKLRRSHEDKCPLCRKECLLSLTVDHLDTAQMNYMKMYFPKEVREKELENDKERVKEQYGEAKCVVM